MAQAINLIFQALFVICAFWILLRPVLRQFLRTRSFKITEYSEASWLGLGQLILYFIYWMFIAFWVTVGQGDEESLETLVFFISCSFIITLYSLFLLLFRSKLMFSKREKVRCAFFVILLFPTFPINFFAFMYLWSQVKKGKKLAVARSKWESEKEVFLKEYKKSSRRLEKLRSAVKSQELRVTEFVEANPSAVLFRAPKDAREFEIICANWMQLWGEIDAKATQFSGDGGIDVVSSNFAAQVKFYANSPVGRPEVQALYGAASGHGLQPAFFAYSNGYTNEALEWGKMMGIACFTFNFVPERNRFEFEANTEQAAELALREEGWSYLDWQEWTELEETFKIFQQEPPAYEPPAWLRKKDAEDASKTTTVEISVE